MIDNKSLKNIADITFQMLESCTLCPRKCKVNRLKNNTGFCNTGLEAKVYSYMAHQGEEPPISGTKGSGAMFFSGCNMACVYCQNYEFSQQGKGRITSDKELALIMLKLQKLGCHNINLVTPTHVLPQILKALLIAVPQGLNIPLIYNTGGYELPEIIKLLAGIVQVYLPDMRYATQESGQKYSKIQDYPKFNRLAIKEMHSQVKQAEFDSHGIIKKGLIIRHLVLPEKINETKDILEFIAREISPDTYISLMSQYMPLHKANNFKELSHRISKKEYGAAQKIMEDLGLLNGWSQETGGLDSLAGIHIKQK